MFAFPDMINRILDKSILDKRAMPNVNPENWRAPIEYRSHSLLHLWRYQPGHSGFEHGSQTDC